ncbi:hypothetical protein CHARACLAT_027156 [Characodon lateralis]|uniref:Uncharacterized protein n=1 Tax=Characodon lateralis TaxID=208331 RepID=A0ABU7D430_9TELE|nr:hypothetical protein [Characodon lateralis]
MIHCGSKRFGQTGAAMADHSGKSWSSRLPFCGARGAFWGYGSCSRTQSGNLWDMNLAPCVPSGTQTSCSNH